MRQFLPVLHRGQFFINQPVTHFLQQKVKAQEKRISKLSTHLLRRIHQDREGREIVWHVLRKESHSGLKFYGTSAPESYWQLAI